MAKFDNEPPKVAVRISPAANTPSWLVANLELLRYRDHLARYPVEQVHLLVQV